MSAAAGATWSIEDIPYETLARASVRDDRRLFDIVASASFIEITSDLYTRNLVEFFASDREVAEWLEQHWQREELQHGAALRKYVETAWPDFDWEAAYRPSIAVVHHDYGAVAAAMIDNLIARIAGRPDVPSIPPFPSEFLARASIGRPPGAR